MFEDRSVVITQSQPLSPAQHANTLEALRALDMATLSNIITKLTPNAPGRNLASIHAISPRKFDALSMMPYAYGIGSDPTLDTMMC